MTQWVNLLLKKCITKVKTCIVGSFFKQEDIQTYHEAQHYLLEVMI